MTFAVVVSDVVYEHHGGAEPALSGVSLSIKAGETVALIGPSGAGKTTLLSLMDDRLRGWKGHTQILGTTLSPVRGLDAALRRRTGFVFQEFALVERSTALRNVLNGRLGGMPPLASLLGWVGAEDMDAARRALEECRISDLAERRVDNLSGGQRQRVAIARCIAQQPDLILADEPISNLDPVRAAEILSLLTRAARERGATTVFSSHQPDLARNFADRMVGLRNGRIVFDAPAVEFPRDAANELYRDADLGGSPRFQVIA